ncbi:hypothetical protein S83_065259 [Arachis hypogaea]
MLIHLNVTWPPFSIFPFSPSRAIELHQKIRESSLSRRHSSPSRRCLFPTPSLVTLTPSPSPLFPTSHSPLTHTTSPLENRRSSSSFCSGCHFELTIGKICTQHRPLFAHRRREACIV